MVLEGSEATVGCWLSHKLRFVAKALLSQRGCSFITIWASGAVRTRIQDKKVDILNGSRRISTKNIL